MRCPKCNSSEDIWIQSTELVRRAVYFEFGTLRYANDVDPRREALLRDRPQYYCSNCEEEFNIDA